MPSYSSTHTGQLIDDTVDSAVLHSEILNLIYPVGSIYLSVNSTDPSTFIGGTWERILDTFLLGAGSTYTAGNSGGSADHTHTYAHTHTTPATTTGNHTLTVAEMPSHNHTHYFWVYNGSMNNNGGNRYGFGYSAQGSLASLSGPASGELLHYNTATGGGGAHSHSLVATTTNSQSTSTTSSGSNLPPYLAVYIWKRVA